MKTTSFEINITDKHPGCRIVHLSDLHKKKFGKENLNGRKKENFLTLVRAFMERGGIELQVNVVDRATLEDARVHPENHRDLIVRIGGYSDYFTRLSPVLQQEIIDRTEY